MKGIVNEHQMLSRAMKQTSNCIGFLCHDGGASVIAYAPGSQLLLSGGRKGELCMDSQSLSHSCCRPDTSLIYRLV